MKQCSKCHVEKPETDFTKQTSKPDGLRSWCRECSRSYDNARAAQNAVALSLEDYQAMEVWATDFERGITAAWQSTGTMEGAADALGTTPNHVRACLSELHRRAARKGWSPGHDMIKSVPVGFHVKGVSTHYDRHGNVSSQWVKSKADEEHRLSLLMDSMQQLLEPMRGMSEPLHPEYKDDSFFDDDTLCVYPMGDPHIGMFAWGLETGQDFDLKIAEGNLITAVDRLVGLAPPSREALIINLGDFFHADNSTNETLRSHHKLDVDSRWSKVLGVGMRIMRRVIDMALTKHGRVTVINEIGNHDDHSAIMLALGLSMYYENNPRVVIDVSPEPFHWYRFGENLLGVTHGNQIKKEQLPGIMATDKRKDWGETEFHYWYTGHIHHDSVREYAGCVVESFRTLAPADVWHRKSGYRSGQDMKCDVLHRKWGRVNRHTVGIRQIWNMQERNNG